MPEPRILICGSIAFDTIMVFADRFSRHILPEKTHVLNVAFLVDDLRREYGGCAGNIAYNLKMLRGEPVVMATIGEDGEIYRQRLSQLQIATDGLRTVPNTYTAQAYITTDLDDNQITAFHPGAMSHSHLNRIEDVGEIALAIVAPDGKTGMQTHVEQLHSAGIPFIFDPGQGLPMFSGRELLAMVERADYVTVNDYEAELLQERTGLSLAMLAERVQALIVTLGAQGSQIYEGGRVHEIPAVQAHSIVDPTGCGDAYRAGLLYGIAHAWDWQKTGRLAALLGSLKIASRGAQNHVFTSEELGTLYLRQFQASL